MKLDRLLVVLILLSVFGMGCSDNSAGNDDAADADSSVADARGGDADAADADIKPGPDASGDATGDAEQPCTEGCSRVRLDGGLKEGTSTFDGKTFFPLTNYLTEGAAHDSDEGLTEDYPILGTDFDRLYQKETWVQSEPATFTIPVENGDYTVHLHFVDWVKKAPEERLFHVDVQGVRRLTDFDIVAEAGPSVALVKSFDVTVSDERVTLKITNNVFYAEIAAVEILPAGEAHLATGAVAVCGAQDGECPAGCSGAQDVDCPAPVCEGGAVDARCLCGSDEVTGGWCCNGAPKDEPCVHSPAFYVSPTGDDTNAGTSLDAPFKTLEKARDAARASDDTKTIYLLGGTYRRSAALALKREDSGQSWLAYPGQTPVLEGADIALDDAYAAISVKADDITIRWITFQNFKKVSIRLGDSPAKNAFIDSNTILNTLSNGWTQAAILACCGDYSGTKITHNLIDGANYNGIGLHSSEGSAGLLDNVTIAHNLVYDTCRTVDDCGAIYLWEPLARSTNIRVDNNIVGNYGTLTNGSKGIYLDDNSSNITVTNNIVYGVGQWALQFHGGARNTFKNNIFDISGAGRLGLYQDTGNGTPADRMADNSFTCNIVYSEATPPGDLWNKYLDSAFEPLLITDNLYWGTHGALPLTGTLVDANPTVADPGFVDPAARDYSFSGANPAAFCGFNPIDTTQVGPLPNNP